MPLSFDRIEKAYKGCVGSTKAAFILLYELILTESRRVSIKNSCALKEGSGMQTELFFCLKTVPSDSEKDDKHVRECRLSLESPKTLIYNAAN